MLKPGLGGGMEIKESRAGHQLICNVELGTFVDDGLATVSSAAWAALFSAFNSLKNLSAATAISACVTRPVPCR